MVSLAKKNVKLTFLQVQFPYFCKISKCAKKRAPRYLSCGPTDLYFCNFFYQAQMQYTSIANFPLNTWFPKVIYSGVFSIARIWLDLWYKDQNSPFFISTSTWKKYQIWQTFNVSNIHTLYCICLCSCCFRLETRLFNKISTHPC
jgi:hypothetical protein